MVPVLRNMARLYRETGRPEEAGKCELTVVDIMKKALRKPE
jgi:hypothetical protein